jgi:hypothetical protein
VSTIKELLGRNSSSGLENRKYGCRDEALTWHLLSAKVGTNFADKERSLGQNSPHVNWGHGVSYCMQNAYRIFWRCRIPFCKNTKTC